MSITFWMPQAPVERVKPYPDEEPDYYEVRVVEPFLEVNMTGGNANAILSLIAPDFVNYEEDPHGTWDQDALTKVRSATIRALNTNLRQRAVAPTEVFSRPNGATVVFHGRDEDYVISRLNTFLRLTKVAMDHGFSVSFG